VARQEHGPVPNAATTLPICHQIQRVRRFIDR
jgi:hypothetical protein